MAYPTIQQYQEALQHPATAFADPVLADEVQGVLAFEMTVELFGRPAELLPLRPE